jgi:type II secretory pathway pseudopilin PulG
VQRGFTYLGLLAALVLGGASLAAIGPAWATQAQRERERELQFRGAEIRAAIERYWAAREPHELPPTLGELLADTRGAPVRHHLRRLYSDPFTGRADWVQLMDDSGQRLRGVRSRAATRRLAHGADGGPLVSDLRFSFDPPVVEPPETAR